MKIRILLFLLVLSITACNYSDDYKKLGEFEERFDLQLDDKTIVIFIPIQGCESCITALAKFTNEKISDGNIRCVASSVSGKKAIRKYFSAECTQSPDFITDSKGFAYQYELVNRSPVVYFFENNQITAKHTITPENFDAVEAQILTFTEN